MFSNKNIDRLFQEKFKNFEQQPNPNLWNGIERRLNENTQKKEPYVFLKSISVIAILGLLIATSFWHFNPSKDTLKTPQDIVKENQIYKTVNLNNAKNSISEKSDIKNTTTRLKKTSNTTHAKNAIFKTITNQKRHTIAIDKHIKKSTALKKYRSNVKQLYNSTTAYPVVSSMETTIELVTKPIGILKLNTPKLIALKNNIKLQVPSLLDLENYIKQPIKDSKETTQKWLMGPSVSPIFYGSLTKGSPIDVQIANSEKSGSVSYSYGMKVAYKLNNKWSLQSGINNLDLSYRTKDIKAVSEVQISYTIPPSNINPETNGSNPNTLSQITIIPKEINGNISPYFGTATIIPGDIKQDLSYTEIPLEVKYNLLGKNLNLQLTGGFSTLFLQKNKITLENNINSLELGEASNLNTLNFSANLGIDVDFKVSNNWYMNFTPSFKYHLNTFSHSSGGFKPYSLGFYTGMNYKF